MKKIVKSEMIYMWIYDRIIISNKAYIILKPPKSYTIND